MASIRGRAAARLEPAGTCSVLAGPKWAARGAVSMPEAIRARIFANCADLGRLLSAAITTSVAVAASSATALGADFLRGSALSLLSGLTQLERHEVVAL